MPPRKKPKLNTQAENLQSPANTPAEGAAQGTPSYDLVADPWTDEQETALLKGIIKWKPVGSSRPSCCWQFAVEYKESPANAIINQACISTSEWSQYQSS